MAALCCAHPLGIFSLNSKSINSHCLKWPFVSCGFFLNSEEIITDEEIMKYITKYAMENMTLLGF